ncbi:MAG: cupin domain-containing protein [Dehalococcoidia bacterium]|nr:cupin domain-containing protein [Dehalococcoidia bacterium]
MDRFPAFMKAQSNAIASGSQSKGVQGYVYDGVDGSQMAFWECDIDGTSLEHVHDYDEYFVVVQGCYILIIDGKRIPVSAGEEYVLRRGTVHAGEFIRGTRTIHAFGGKRAERMQTADQR